MSYLVRYPSGKRLRLSGELEVAVLGDNGACPIIDDGEQVVVLDPRAIVRDRASGEVVYHPSMVAESLAPWVREWLGEHLAWEVER